MAVGNVPEILEVKHTLKTMKEEGLIADWELPYENLLTRLSAAIFFITPAKQEDMQKIHDQLNRYQGFECKENTKKSLSQLEYQVEFH